MNADKKKAPNSSIEPGATNNTYRKAIMTDYKQNRDDGFPNHRLEEQPKPPKLTSGLLTLVLSIAATFGYGLASGFSQFHAANQAAPTTQAESPAVRLAEYERVEPGMSLVEVQAILGRGTETSRSATIATFSWKNSDGSGITAVFEKSRLKSKEQSGLK